MLDKPDRRRYGGPETARIRVLITHMPRILADIIGATLTAQPDMEVARDETTTSALLDAMEHRPPDVLVVGLQNADLPEGVETLFERSPSLRVLGIAVSGRNAFLHELRPHRLSLGELSPDQLVDVIRTAGTAPRLGWHSSDRGQE